VLGWTPSRYPNPYRPSGSASYAWEWAFSKLLSSTLSSREADFLSL